MAFGYYTIGTQSNWKPELMASFKTLAESEGWTTIENGYNDGTYTRWVFESDTEDFYVVFFCFTSRLNTSSSTSAPFADLGYTICEDYDSGTKEFIKPAVFASTAFAAASDGSLGTTQYSIAGLITASVGLPAIRPYTSSSVPLVSYFINIYSGHASMAISQGSTVGRQALSIGKFTSLVLSDATNDPVCLGVASNGITYTVDFNAAAPSLGTSVAGFTRSAMNGGKAAHRWDMTFGAWLGSSAYAQTDVAPTTKWDLYQKNIGPSMSPIAVRRTVTSDVTTFGSLRALIPRRITGGSSALFNDTLTIGGNEYVHAGSGTWFRKG